jgi:hypothetical protein
MNTDFIAFPTTARRFFLRWDFPDELGFQDYATSRAVQKQVRTQVFCEEETKPPIVDAYDVDLCETYRRARLYLYCGLGVKDVGTVAPYVTDGKDWMPTPAVGLYKAMLERAGRAHGAPDKVLVFPPTTGGFRDWVFPANAVLHDTACSSAAIVPYATAFNYLQQHNNLK